LLILASSFIVLLGGNGKIDEFSAEITSTRL